MGSSSQPGCEHSSLQPGARSTRSLVLVSVYRQCGEGLTEKVESLFKHNPMKRFTMREIVLIIQPTPLLGEVSSVLHKMEFRKRCLERGRGHNGMRIVDTWKWRID